MADGNIDLKTAEQIATEIGRIGGDHKALAESTQREITTMRALIEEHGANMDPLIKAQVEKLGASWETRYEALESGVKDVSALVDDVKTAMNRGGEGWGGGEDAAVEAKAAYEFEKIKMINSGRMTIGAKVEPDLEAIKAYGSTFDVYARRGDEKGSHLTNDFRNALQTGNDPDGGYLVPTETSNRIIEKVYETSPLRQLAHVERIGTKDLEIPRDEGEFGAGWVGETQARPETSTSPLGMTKIVVHEMYASPRATQNMLEDAAIDVAAWMGRKVGQKFGRLENQAFFIGDGVGKPVGLLTPPSGTNAQLGQVERINSGAATDFTFDGLINTVFSLLDPYEANASWILNRLGLRNVAKLKDGEGRYIWDMANVKGKVGRGTLLGYPVSRATDISAPGAGNIMAAFGDFNEAYTIVDRLGITTLRDPYTAKPFVIFYSRRRVGGAPVNFEAYKLVVGAA